MLVVPRGHSGVEESEDGEGSQVPASSIENVLRSHASTISAKALSKLCRSLTVDLYRHFTTMELSDCEIDGPTLDLFAQGVLPHCQFLQHLYLDSNIIGADGLSMRTMMTLSCQITHLTFVDNALGDEGAAMVARGLAHPESKILYLDLSSNRIHAAGARAIARALPFSRLKWLSLQCNMIGDTGCREIGKALKNNVELESLFLAQNFITNGAVDSLLTGLGLNTKLAELHITDNFFTPKRRELILTISAFPEIRLRLQSMLALAYGAHPRVGKFSLVRRLPIDILRIVREMLYSVDSIKPPTPSKDEETPFFAEVDSDFEDDFVNIF